MKKEKIFITNIAKMIETISYLGDSEPSTRSMGTRVSFRYKTIEADIILYTDEPLTEEEIKDRIIEVIN